MEFLFFNFPKRLSAKFSTKFSSFPAQAEAFLDKLSTIIDDVMLIISRIFTGKKEFINNKNFRICVKLNVFIIICRTSYSSTHDLNFAAYSSLEF